MTTTEVQLAPELECLRCGHKWHPRQKTVRVCPECKSAYWDTPKRKLIQKRCARDSGTQVHE